MKTPQYVMQNYQPLNPEQFEGHVVTIGDYSLVSVIVDLNKRLEAAERELEQIRNAALRR